MEASLIEYFELEKADYAEETKEDTPPLEEDASPDESALTEDNTPLTDADYASVAEDTTSYTASEQTAVSETGEAEKPPEKPLQDTQ